MTSADMTECTRLAATQFGVIARDQALKIGLSKSAVDRLIKDGLWLRLHQSIYALWVPTAASERWRQRLVAGALWLGDGSGASHRAAAIDWQIAGVDSSPLEFSTTGDRRISIPGFIIHRVKFLPPRDITVRDGLRLTTPARTIVDLAGLLSAQALEIALESVRHMKLATVDEIGLALEHTGATHKGRQVLRSLLESLPSIATESPKETAAWQFFRAAGLPLPVRQYNVKDKTGRFVARVDFAYPDLKIAIEFDSVKWHARPRDVRRDNRRQNALIKVGWLPFRISSDDLVNRASATATDLREIYRSRQSLGNE